MEPEWTKAISNETICNFFYVFFIIYAVISGLIVLYILGLALNFKKLAAVGMPLILQSVIVLALGTTQLLFHYLICSRSIVEQQKA